MKNALLTFGLLAAFGAGCMGQPAAPAPRTQQPVVPVQQPASSTPPPANAVMHAAPAPVKAKQPSLQPNATTTKSALQRVNVSIIGHAFEPGQAAIHVGDTIVWTNKDAVNHTVAGANGAFLWDSGNLAPGKSFSRTFNSPGTYTYHCGIHPDMVAQIIVH